MIDDRPLVGSRGWTPQHFLLLDLQTGEGTIFRLAGSAHADLNAHKIWVCPLCEPTLEWLYARYKAMDHDVATWWDTMPVHVDIPEAQFALFGYRRTGRL